MNERVRDLLGLDPSTVIGLRGVDFLPDERRGAALAEFRTLLAQGGLAEPRVVPIPQVGDRRGYLEVTLSPYDYTGERRMLVVGRNVTARVEAEESLARERDDLAQTVIEREELLNASLARLREQERLAAVGTLAAGIAHQINNPVGAISAAAEFALVSASDPQADAVREDSLKRIVEESARAGRIVKSILRFARHGTTNKWDDDLARVVGRSIELVRPYVHERGGTIELEGPAGAIPIAMSPIEVEQALVNLVRNAAEAIRPGGHIHVRLSRTATHALVEVIDEGIGMNAETRSQIFDPFFTTRLRDGGSGLGLSVVHGIVTEHGGEIEVESEPGAGTRIALRFPIAQRTAPPRRRGPSSDPPQLAV